MATPQELDAARKAAAKEVTDLRRALEKQGLTPSQIQSNPELRAAQAKLEQAKGAAGFLTTEESLALLSQKGGAKAYTKAEREAATTRNTALTTTKPTDTTVTTETTTPVDPRGMMAARDAARLLAEQYGLGGDFFDQIEGLLYEDISEASLILALRSTDAYKKRFAANATRVAKGLPALSEAEYIRMESLYRQELRAAGLPPTFYDDMEDFKTYIENDISYNEFVGRVGLARRASQMANPEVKRQLKDLYQVGEDQLVAYFLNPQKTTTMLQRQFNVAQTAGALSRAGFGTTMAEELTSTVTGGSPETVLNYGELEAAAQTAATARPLSMEVLGGEGGAVTEQDLLRGVVAEDVQSQRRIQREQQRRLAEYQAGGSLIESQQGVLGLRSASR